jgi:hypothetical protein
LSSVSLIDSSRQSDPDSDRVILNLQSSVSACCPIYAIQ